METVKWSIFAPNDNQDTNSFVLKKIFCRREALALLVPPTAVFGTDIAIEGGAVDTYISAVGIMYVQDNC